MNSSTRFLLPAVLAVAAASACAPSGERSAPRSRPAIPAAQVLATFEGRLDPATGTLTITETPATASVAGIVPYAPWSDGIAGSGPKNTFELRNGTVTGTGTACGGSAASWEGQVILTSFFDTQGFSDVAVELVSLSPGGNEACNSDAPHDGMSNTYGFWDYGPLAAGGTATRTWRFANPTSEYFTFRGRILAAVGPLPAPVNGATAFDWSPYLFADPPHAFQHQATTLAHVVWDGTDFVDDVGTLAFVPQGTAAASHAVGLRYPAQAWAGPFASGANRYQATDNLHLTGDFTACVKFRPGTDPAPGDRKVLLAKGNPVAGAAYGWALAQQHGQGQQYGFWYYSPGQGSSYDTFLSPGTDHPESSIFDYVCGGRDGSNVRVVSHGRDIRFDLAVGSALPTPDTLPLVIGAQADGGWPAVDAGVYEVVIDSRPATLSTMAEIVSRAEGRRLYDGGTYWGNDTDARAVVGTDGVTYGFPLGSTAPVSSDGSGLLDAGTILSFGGTAVGLGGILAGSPSSYCVGAEVSSTSWSGASGCVLGDVNGTLKIFFLGTGVAATTGTNQWRAVGGDTTAWAANSRHTFVVCTPGTSANTARLYVDGSAVGQSDANGPQFDLTAGQISVGTCGYGGGSLTGARVGRVFACPTNDAASCQ